VIVPDLKGFNDSEKPQFRKDYTPDQICEELKQFLDALNIKEVVVIGHNLGGLIG
jgi:pimeloyl-ACP methyl ester carboxylesterase